MKKMISILAAAVSCAALMAAPLCSDAAVWCGDSEYVSDYIKDATLVENNEYTAKIYDWLSKSEYIGDENWFYINGNEHMIQIVASGKEYADFAVSADIPGEEVQAFARQLDPDYIAHPGASTKEGFRYYILQHPGTKNLTENEAREAYAALDEKFGLKAFKYYTGLYNIYPGVGLNMYNAEQYLEPAKQYIAENGLDWQITQTASSQTYFWVDPAEGADASEYLNIFFSLSEANIRCDLAFMEGVDSVSTEIDLLGAVEYDANLDGRVNMADAVLVTQAVNNPDKYGLGKPEGITPQGAFNADAADPGSGITMLDAYLIQKNILGIE